MACNITISGRGPQCKTTIGGVFKIYIGEFEDLVTSSEVLSNGTITGITGTAYSFDLTKNSGNFVQNITSSVENGTIYFEQTLSVTLNTMTAIDNDELADLITARLFIVVEDNNGQKFLMGKGRGAECVGGNFSTGQALGDLNGYTLEFTAEELRPAPFLGASDGGLSLTQGS